MILHIVATPFCSVLPSSFPAATLKGRQKQKEILSTGAGGSGYLNRCWIYRHIFCFANNMKMWLFLFCGKLPKQLRGEESAWECRRCGFDPWVRKIPGRRTWQPTPVFLPGKVHEQRSLAGYSPRESQKAGHDWSDLACTYACSVGTSDVYSPPSKKTVMCLRSINLLNKTMNRALVQFSYQIRPWKVVSLNSFVFGKTEPGWFLIGNSALPPPLKRHFPHLFLGTGRKFNMFMKCFFSRSFPLSSFEQLLSIWLVSDLFFFF